MPFLKYLKTHARDQYVSESPAQLITTQSEFPARVTIGELSDLVSDNLLLNIFRYYLDVSPRHHWPRLVHICRRWRRIVFASQRVLHLRMFCIHGTPVLKTLCCWPATPIIVQYGGSLELGPPAPKDEGNIMAALKQSGRVSSINLTATKSLLKRLSSIKMPFSELEDLVLHSRDGVRLTFSSAFRWGSRLRCLHSTRIAIPGLLQLLYSSTNLVDLQLHEVFDSWQFPPEALTDALSRMTQLQSLSLHFFSTTNYHPRIPQSWTRAVLPVLTRLDIRGVPLYLERLVARLDAPRLGDIELTFLNEITIGFPTLLEFIHRIEMHKSHRRADILSSERAISISLIPGQPGTLSCLKLQLFCESPSEKLLFMTRVCIHLSTSLSSVEDLRISTTRPSGRGDGDCSGWLGLLNTFTGVKWFHLDCDHATNIVSDLKLSERGYESILPSLHKFYIPHPGQRHAPLAEAIVSFMISRQLSGHHMAVEYERLYHINELRGTDPLSQQMMIEMLSDDIFLNIFRYYLDAAPQAWPTLTYVCQRWRQIVHTSPLGLNLRLYFMPGTPVSKALDCWTALPIMVQYGGSDLDPSSPEDEDNIIAALKQPSRVSSISITVTDSLLESLSTILEPFLELEELVLRSRDNVQLTLSGTFRWGPRLRTLHSTRIAFPSLPQLLSPSHDLVDIQLHEIPSAGYFSPEAFANSLSGMTNLRTLSLHFLSLPPRRNYLGLPPLSRERVVLPALTSLKYRGTSKYLDSFVARIDAPGLGDLDITLFSQPTIDASQLGRFIERTGIQQTPLCQAVVQISGDAISMITSSGSSTPLRLQISCKRLDWQLSSMAQVCDQISPFHIETLGINTTQSPSGQDDTDVEQWLELIRSFSSAKGFHVAGVHAEDILCALHPAHLHTTNSTLLPALCNLRVAKPIAMDGPSWDAVRSFIASRSLSGSPVQVTAPSYQCHICYARFRQQHDLRYHLEGEHGYQRACLYCDDFRCVLGYHSLFPEHIQSEHPEVACNDALISGPVLERFHPIQLDSFIDRHSSPRPPVPISMDSDTGREPIVT